MIRPDARHGVRPGAPLVTVEVDIAQGHPGHDVDASRWRALAEAALVTEGVGHGQVDLFFVDEETIAGLNTQHLGVDGPTDVLSFPLDEAPAASVVVDGEPPVIIGDVVVCPAVAARYSVANGRTPDDELALLVVHGVLHLLGHDHAEPDEAERMQARERHILGLHHR